MALYRFVHSTFWSDSRVMEEMTPEDKYFYLYLLTNQSTTQIGIYQITKKKIAFELGYSNESVNILMERFENHHKLIKYNTATRELAIKNWGKYNFTRLGKPMVDCIKKELQGVKDLSLVEYIMESIEKTEVIELYNNLLLSNNDGFTTRDTIRGEKQEQEEKQDKKEKEKEEQKQIEKTCGSGFDIREVFNHIERCGFGLLSPIIIEKITADIEIYGSEWVVRAAEVAAEKGKPRYDYFKAILSNWKINGCDYKKHKIGGNKDGYANQDDKQNASNGYDFSKYGG